MPAPKNSTGYSQILKSSSIIGGAQGINYVIGMVRTKIVAILLGPSGIGLIGLYQSVVSLIATTSSLGIANSGVRVVAEASASGDQKHLALTVGVLRKACWITGVGGWLLTAALSYPLSVWAFGSGERAATIAILGGTILLTAISGGQSCILQGTRRIGDLAKLQVISMVASTVTAIPVYAFMGERGIVPVLLLTALLQTGFTWWFSRKIKTDIPSLSLNDTWKHSRQMLSLGIAFMWGALTATATAFVIRLLIVKNLGTDANGIYQAAWGISGLFAGFILGAMGTDFYPRLTGVAKDNILVNEMVNEQTEIGLLLALPGIIATLAFAPWLMTLLYSSEFIAGSALLPWFIIGVLGRVISWPLGYMLLAKGESRWYAFTETLCSLLNLAFCFFLLPIHGLTGIAIAFPALYAFYNIGMLFLTYKLTRFIWSKGVIKLLTLCVALIVSSLVSRWFLTPLLATTSGVLLTLAGLVISLRGIGSRLGEKHRITKLLAKLPLGHLLCGVKARNTPDRIPFEK